jgi:hypothetical protein
MWLGRPLSPILLEIVTCGVNPAVLSFVATRVATQMSIRPECLDSVTSEGASQYSTSATTTAASQTEQAALVGPTCLIGANVVPWHYLYVTSSPLLRRIIHNQLSGVVIIITDIFGLVTKN